MRLTIEHYDIKVTIEHERDDLSFNEVVNDMIKPAFLAVGFQPETIKRFINEVEQ